jgi:DNA polymerase-3 subunit epsilon
MKVTMSNIIFLDTETTALLEVEAADLQHQPHIVELFCLKTDTSFQSITSLHLRMKPPIPIPKQSSDIHGISDAHIADKLPFAGYYRQIAHYFVGVTYMIGHNLQYDKRMLHYELQRINKVTNFPWPPINVCTVEETFKVKGHRMSLTDLYMDLFGETFVSAHSAEADTRALMRVYREMIKKQMLKEPT